MPDSTFEKPNDDPDFSSKPFDGSFSAHDDEQIEANDNS
jgi:hypothetical protein